MAVSGCMQSAVSSLWQSGRIVQLVSPWSHCSGPKPDQQSSVCSMQPLISIYGTCWKMTESLWSPKAWILTGNTRQTWRADLSEEFYIVILICGVHVLFSPQGDSHGCVWRLRTTKHIFRSSTGTRVRKNRNVVFHKTFYCTRYCRRGETGEHDDWSLLKHYSLYGCI